MSLLISFSPDTVIAGNHSTYTTTVYKAKKQSQHTQDIDDEGRRTPPIPLCCIISFSTGLSIVGVGEDILNFEIWDPETEACVASFSEESEFIDYLFSQSGDFQIKIETENYNISGYISFD